MIRVKSWMNALTLTLGGGRVDGGRDSRAVTSWQQQAHGEQGAGLQSACQVQRELTQQNYYYDPATYKHEEESEDQSQG